MHRLKDDTEDLSHYIVPGRNMSGITNMGNTCFMNAAVQCLSATIPLTRYLLSQQFQHDLNIHKGEHLMLIEYYRVVEALWEENQTIQPKSFKKTLSSFYKQYQGWRQHDSHEVLLAILDMLHKATSFRVKIGIKGVIEKKFDQMNIEAIKRWNTCFKSEYSPIIQMMYGQYHSEMKCTLCNKSVHNYDPFSIIEIPINDCMNLQDGLDSFTKIETLDDNNRWKCENCGELVNAKKRIRFWTLPEILIITLKRFNMRANGRGYKLQHNVDFPIDSLNMSSYMSRPSSKGDYELYAVNCHSGGTNGGHYFAYCKNLNGSWYMHNDAADPLHYALKPHQVVTPKAYILFYRLKK